VHVEAGHGHLTEAILIPRQDRDEGDDAGPQHAADDVPVGQVDVLGAASRDGCDEIPRGDDERGQKDQADRPWPFPIFQITVVEAQIESDRAGHCGQVEQRQSNPS
jgi:hypothetical protein